MIQNLQYSPLCANGWLEFNRYKWNVKPLRIRLSEDGKEVPAVETVLYLDRRGRIIQPPLNPYLPLIFHATPTDKVTRLYRQWRIVSALLVEEFKRRGLARPVAFPPDVIDVREWQWHGFLAEVRYTFRVRLPIQEDQIDYAVRKQIKKAQRSGYVCEVASISTLDLDEVVECLRETERRQDFAYRLSSEDFKKAIQFLGEDLFRIYSCRTPANNIASIRIVLATPGAWAIDWVAGTKTESLKSGATQYLIWHILNDLVESDVQGFDFAGANLPTISEAKSVWGGQLTPYWLLHPPHFRTILRFAKNFFANKRRK